MLRLEKIKLAGFKSFVDPTTVELKSNLMGIVGPNGCGKSNIIDAVRWVLGESSAKQLRGGSIADVIFNGSSARKPVGQASVELNFDNSDGSLGGQYAEYSQISVRREVNRDAISTYYLNGTKCRRRDITDVFLGTGLGPRSYAIIEQGTISRFVEAKPDELRVYLEEAAGISKYKERRRETETRIRHTRDNLDRLQDIRDELEKQLNHLQRQAKAAQRFKELKIEERDVESKLYARQWQELQAEAKSLAEQTKAQELKIEAQLAELRSLDAQIEKHRSEHTDLQDAFNECQASYYTIGNDIARLEQSIADIKSRRQQLETDLSHVKTQLEEAERTLANDQAQYQTLETELNEIKPQAEQAESEAAGINEKLKSAEQQMQAWQSRWDEHHQQANEAQQQAHVEQTRIQQLEENMQKATQKLERLKETESQFNTDEITSSIHQLDNDIKTAESAQAGQQTKVSEIAEHITQTRDEIQSITTELNTARQEYQSQSGRLSSLHALQETALGKEEQNINEWLEAHNLHDKPRLIEGLDVTAPWEHAIEVVLADNVEAIIVDSLEDYLPLLTQFDGGNITVYANHAQHAASNSCDTPRLANHVDAKWQMPAVLQHVYAVTELDDALALVSKLQTHESVITPEGIWLGAGWVKICRGEDPHQGVFTRKQEIESIETELQSFETKISEHETKLQTARQRLDQHESQRDDQQRVFNQLASKTSDLHAQARVKQSRIEHIQQRQQQNNNEQQEQQGIIDSANAEVQQRRNVWQAAMNQVNQCADRRETLLIERETNQENLQGLRETAKQHREHAHQFTVQCKTLEARLQGIAQGQERLTAHVEQLQQRSEYLTKQSNEAIAPLDQMQTQLQEKLGSQRNAEEHLTQAREKLLANESLTQETEKSRHTCEEVRQAQRERLEQARMKQQTIKVRQETQLEYLAKIERELEQVLQTLEDDVSLNVLSEEFERIKTRIARLGAINLAAIDEFAQASERKTYLDSQNDDLIEALTTLENAIAKIDRETRQRFKDTFDKVNNAFKNLFPRVFGGGQAYLELTGEDLLDTGITVMARPPGKRNATIHMLSGGEKALTAVALVFAIFQLNPAPFCMLDEVDAPLDDANVVRFCNLLKEMSEEIQFIFISHNKLTIEIANQLLGVTMQEPGVSRLVSVDMAEAVEMVEA